MFWIFLTKNKKEAVKLSLEPIKRTEIKTNQKQGGGIEQKSSFSLWHIYISSLIAQNLTQLPCILDSTPKPV